VEGKITEYCRQILLEFGLQFVREIEAVDKVLHFDESDRSLLQTEIAQSLYGDRKPKDVTPQATALQTFRRRTQIGLPCSKRLSYKL
jgi:hypothetical protein